MNPADVAVVVTSTIIPNSNNWYGTSLNAIQPSVNERCQQTLLTIQSLSDLGFVNIYLIDNSKESIPSKWIKKFESTGVRFLSLPARNNLTRNKGISEIELLLEFCQRVRLQAPILKISGRYVLNSIKLLDIERADIIGRVFHRRRGFSEFSTKAYMVINTIVWESILRESAKSTKFLVYKFWTPYLFRRLTFFLRDVFIKGKFHLVRDPTISIEEGFYYSFKSLNLNLKNIDELGVSGVLAAEGKLVSE